MGLLLKPAQMAVTRILQFTKVVEEEHPSQPSIPESLADEVQQKIVTLPEPAKISLNNFKATKMLKYKTNRKVAKEHCKT